MHLLVVGGTGLIGQNIVRAAALRGWHVTALSRKGAPSAYLTPDAPHTSTSPPPGWTSNVTWARGDALDASTTADHASRADAVVHAVGILFQTPEYNAVVNAPTLSSALAALPRALRPHSRPVEFADVQTSMLTELAAAAKGKPVVYVSAEVSPLMRAAVNAEYLRTKRTAEDALNARNEKGEGRSVVVRPGIVASTHRPLTYPLALGGHLLHAVGLVPRVLSPETIAQAVVGAVAREDVKGILNPDAIAELAAASEAAAVRE
ncbi:hypothetical protein H9P43_006295 [Blastocladiella emersonii ATCC 22665]|nr:hypothetical protein H9P43_006295 [Blastocladiella emersonii ATCC 22665]